MPTTRPNLHEIAAKPLTFIGRAVNRKRKLQRF